MALHQIERTRYQGTSVARRRAALRVRFESLNARRFHYRSLPKFYVGREHSRTESERQKIFDATKLCLGALSALAWCG